MLIQSKISGYANAAALRSEATAVNPTVRDVVQILSTNTLYAWRENAAGTDTGLDNSPVIVQGAASGGQWIQINSGDVETATAAHDAIQPGQQALATLNVGGVAVGAVTDVASVDALPPNVFVVADQVSADGVVTLLVANYSDDVVSGDSLGDFNVFFKNADAPIGGGVSAS